MPHASMRVAEMEAPQSGHHAERRQIITWSSRRCAVLGEILEGAGLMVSGMLRFA